MRRFGEEARHFFAVASGPLPVPRGASLALPIVAGIARPVIPGVTEVSVGRYWNGNARLIRLLIAPITFPSDPVSLLMRVGWRINRVALRQGSPGQYRHEQ